MDNNSKVAVGVLAGLAAGAVLGILFAPAKGSETRKNLTGKGKEYVDGLVNGVTETFTDLKNSVTESLGSAGDVVAELAEKAISKTETSKADLKNTIASNDKNHQQSVTNQNRH
jgi:gas vesicle protein